MIKFVRVYESGGDTVYEALHTRKNSTRLRCQMYFSTPPKTVLEYILCADKVKTQYDQFHGKEVIYSNKE